MSCTHFIPTLMFDSDKVTWVSAPESEDGNLYELTKSGNFYEITENGEVYKLTESGKLYELTEGGEVYELTKNGETSMLTASGEAYKLTKDGVLYEVTSAEPKMVYKITKSGEVKNITHRWIPEPELTKLIKDRAVYVLNKDGIEELRKRCESIRATNSCQKIYTND